MSTISLRFGVRTRNWPGTDFQPLEFNFEFYFWNFRGEGGGGADFGEFQQRVKIVGRSLYRAQNLLKITKKCLYHFSLSQSLAFVAKLYLSPDFPRLEAIKSISVPRLSGNYLNKRRFLDFFRTFGKS